MAYVLKMNMPFDRITDILIQTSLFLELNLLNSKDLLLKNISVYTYNQKKSTDLKNI